MYVLMCYQIALFAECLITYFTGKWVLTPVYITGISAFSTVYVKLFIQSTLVETKDKHSDKKNNCYGIVYIK
jgi:hypothetical protein